MAIASADLHKAVNTAWNSSGLDGKFTELWKNSLSPDYEFQVLNDGEAGPAQPMPYCVYEQGAGSTITRMSGVGNSKWEIRDVPWEFRVQARETDNDPRTAKEVAAYLVEEIMKVYGGHPTQAPTVMSLDNGTILLAQYQNDYGIRTGDNEHAWIVAYLLRLDIPVMTPA